MAVVSGAACRADCNFCPQELMQRDVGYVFPLCQASVTQLQVFVPLHLRTHVLNALQSAWK